MRKGVEIEVTGLKCEKDVEKDFLFLKKEIRPQERPLKKGRPDVE
jgi:hypothetical protein